MLHVEVLEFGRVFSFGIIALNLFPYCVPNCLRHAHAHHDYSDAHGSFVLYFVFVVDVLNFCFRCLDFVIVYVQFLMINLYLNYCVLTLAFVFGFDK